MPDGEKVFLKTILKNPTKYFTKEILDKIDAVAHKEFLYGEVGLEEVSEEEDVERTE
jgi:hypothetical protein